MPNPLIRKLERGAALTHKDRSLLQKACERTRQVGSRQDIIREGERPEKVHLVLAGFACRYKTLEDGSRQNMALLVPGDFCDLHVAILGQMDHSIATLSACTIVDIPRATILDLTENHPGITRALWWCTLVDEATLREWLLSMGQREAGQQMAHLVCELLLRLQSVGLADKNGYDLPITQVELGETLGISSVHVNRVLQALREAGLIEWKGQRLTIPDIDRLKAFCGFTANYLHLQARVENGAPQHK